MQSRGFLFSVISAAVSWNQLEFVWDGHKMGTVLQIFTFVCAFPPKKRSILVLILSDVGIMQIFLTAANQILVRLWDQLGRVSHAFAFLSKYLAIFLHLTGKSSGEVISIYLELAYMYIYVSAISDDLGSGWTIQECSKMLDGILNQEEKEAKSFPVGSWAYHGWTKLSAKIHVRLPSLLSSWTIGSVTFFRGRALEWVIDSNRPSVSWWYPQGLQNSETAFFPEKMALPVGGIWGLWIWGYWCCGGDKEQWRKIWGWAEGTG